MEVWTTRCQAHQKTLPRVTCSLWSNVPSEARSVLQLRYRDGMSSLARLTERSRGSICPLVMTLQTRTSLQTALGCAHRRLSTNLLSQRSARTFASVALS